MAFHSALQGHRRGADRHHGGPGATHFRKPLRPGPAHRDGKLKGLATTGEVRNPQAPGAADHDRKRRPGVSSRRRSRAGRAGRHAAEIVRRLNAELNAGLNSPEIGSTFAKLGVGSRPLSPEEFGAFSSMRTRKWSAVARTATSGSSDMRRAVFAMAVAALSFTTSAPAQKPIPTA